MSNNDSFLLPELLSPAGDMSRLKAAVKFGADAVYLGGSIFSMRTAPENFSNEELFRAVDYCHERNVKVYLACNVLARNEEFGQLPNFLENAKKSGVDGLIISDLGVMDYAKKYAEGVEIHISTQAGVVNFATANVLYQMGAKRIVPARELSLAEIARLRANIPADMDIECFVHGAMCVSF
ncbi:MAG: peptidase U32 family protein, partial [Acutalibacteraceae bacterium]